MSSTVGARFEVEMSNLENTMRKAIFLYEKGPSQYHIAHLLQYHLDRILGVGTKTFVIEAERFFKNFVSTQS
jgi:hypothetical protein